MQFRQTFGKLTVQKLVENYGNDFFRESAYPRKLPMHS